MDFLNKLYNYLESRVENDGSLRDGFLNAPLNFQYHYTGFVLSSILLNRFGPKTRKVLEYFLAVSEKTGEVSAEFNNLFLLLALYFDGEGKLKEYRESIKKKIIHRSDEILEPLNYNFRFIKLTNLYLEKRTGKDNDTAELREKLEDYLCLQMKDGFFQDSQIAPGSTEKGVPHLAYHAKMTMLNGLIYLLSGEEKAADALFKGIDALLSLLDFPYYFNYGRSTNSIFAYASFYTALKCAHIISRDKKYDEIALKIKDFVKYLQKEDGHVSINLTVDERNRPGYDGYMYCIVYNTYALAMFLLGEKLAEKFDDVVEPNLKPNRNTVAPKLRVNEDSGFIRIERNNFSAVFNIRGHQNSVKHRFDSRVSPFSLISFVTEAGEAMPGMGFPPQPLYYRVETKNRALFLKSVFFKLIYYKWLPLLSGNTFAYRRNGIFYYPYRCTGFEVVSGAIKAMFEARGRGMVQKTESRDKFEVKIFPEEAGLSFRFELRETAETIIYTFRRKTGRNSLSYELNSGFVKLKPLLLQTSRGKMVLERNIASGLKHFKVYISARIPVIKGNIL